MAIKEADGHQDFYPIVVNEEKEIIHDNIEIIKGVYISRFQFRWLMEEQVLLNLTAQLTEMNSLIKKLNEDMQILRDENTRLKNENALLKEENKYLKKKLFGTKSETSYSLGFGQLSFF